MEQTLKQLLHRGVVGLCSLDAKSMRRTGGVSDRQSRCKSVQCPCFNIHAFHCGHDFAESARPGVAAPGKAAEFR